MSKWYCAQGPGCPCCTVNHPAMDDLDARARDRHSDRNAEAALVERSRIVRWLRAQATESQDYATSPHYWSDADKDTLTEAADAIERGEHLK